MRQPMIRVHRNIIAWKDGQLALRVIFECCAVLVHEVVDVQRR